MATHEADPAKAEPFAERMLADVRGAAVTLRAKDEIAECFRNDRGVPYSTYARFQHVQAEDSAAVP
jgi:hypothetical protein